MHLTPELIELEALSNSIHVKDNQANFRLS
jgi:hypothetical protein